MVRGTWDPWVRPAARKGPIDWAQLSGQMEWIGPMQQNSWRRKWQLELRTVARASRYEDFCDHMGSVRFPGFQVVRQVHQCNASAIGKFLTMPGLGHPRVAILPRICEVRENGSEGEVGLQRMPKAAKSAKGSANSKN